TLNEVAGRVRLRQLSPGQPVVRQGEPARAYYVVRRGTVEVVEEMPDGGTRVIRSLGPGHGFGELGVAERAPRTATVRAATNAEVFELDVGTFQRLLEPVATPRRYAPSVGEVDELRRLGPFRHLEMEELVRLLELGRWVNVPPGT